jgi:OmpA-OmpF porin, OOP family
MKKYFMLTVIMMLMFVVKASQADITAGSFSFTPFIGGYGFEGNENLKNTYTAGLRAGYNFTERWGVEGFFNYVPTEVKDAVDADVKLYGYGIEGIYHLTPEGHFVPFLAIGIGGLRYNVPTDGLEINKFAVDYGAGLKYFLTDDIALRADVRHILPFNDRYNDLLVTFGITYFLGGKKKEVVTARYEEPAPPKEIVIPPKVEEPPALKASAAPVEVLMDSDKDGVPDNIDKCPHTPAGANVDKDGCTPIVEQKQEALVVVQKPLQEKISVALNVKFNTAKSFIKKKYHNEIKKMADFMNAHPEANAVIEGHTDNVDIFHKPEKNVRLSKARADRVRKYLIEKFGIDASRITAVGYGLTRPIAGNDTKKGRKKNRRAQAVIETGLK